MELSQKKARAGAEPGFCEDAILWRTSEVLFIGRGQLVWPSLVSSVNIKVVKALALVRSRFRQSWQVRSCGFEDLDSLNYGLAFAGYF